MTNLKMYLLVFFITLTWFFPVSGFSDDTLTLPDSFGSPLVLNRVDEIKTWSPDNMYEHVNGEAELLKRYGALSLSYVSYEGEGEAYLSSEILDLGEPINAYGLYRLYAGCDGEEYRFSNTIVLFDEFTSHAILGRHFVRINADIDGSREKIKLLVDEFLSELSKALPPPEPLPAILEHLKQAARKPCEVDYHPEHMDYDLESGPGYMWAGPGGETFYLRLLLSQDEAKGYAAILGSKGLPAVHTGKNVVVWQKDGNEQSSSYIEEVLKNVLSEK